MSAPAAISAGLCAGIGACLKPYFLLIAFAPDAWWMLTRRAVRPVFRPEVLTFFFVGSAYAVSFLVAPEPMRAAMFGRWVPLIVSGYASYDKPMARIVLGEAASWLPATACGLILLTRRSESAPWNLVKPVAVVALASAVSFFVQHKGWLYHAIPAQVSASVVVALLLGRLAISRPLLASVPSVRGLLAALGLTLTAALAIAITLVVSWTIHPKTAIRVTEHLERDPVARAIGQHTAPGDPVLVLATTVSLAYPLLTQIDRKPASRFFAMFPIPWFYYGVKGQPGQPFPYRTVEPGIPNDERAFLSELQTDIRTTRPKVILVDRRPTCDWCPQGFGVYDYLSRTDFIARAMADYRDAGRVANYELYLINGEP